MPIRNYLKRRRNNAVLFVLPGIVFCVLSAVFAPDSFWLTWLSLAALLAGLVTVILLLYRTPCPQCQRPLGSIAARAANGWAKNAHCPHCRVSLEEPIKSRSKHGRVNAAPRADSPQPASHECRQRVNPAKRLTRKRIPLTLPVPHLG
jgi:hypothetical protein